MRDYIDRQVTPPTYLGSPTLISNINFYQLTARGDKAWECAGCYKKQYELTEETKASPSGRRAKSSEPLAEKIKQSQSILVKISLNGGTTHKDVVWQEAWLLESVCSGLGLLTCKYNRFSLLLAAKDVAKRPWRRGARRNGCIHRL